MLPESGDVEGGVVEIGDLSHEMRWRVCGSIFGWCVGGWAGEGIDVEVRPPAPEETLVSAGNTGRA